VGHGTVAPQRRADGTGPGAARALLPPGLLAAAAHLAAGLGGVRALTLGRQLRLDDLMHQRDVGRVVQRGTLRQKTGLTEQTLGVLVPLLRHVNRVRLLVHREIAGLDHALAGARIGLATAADLEDFAIGFSLTEGIVNSPDEIASIRVHHRSVGIEVRMRISAERQSALAGRERNLTGRTGCGLCGTTSLRQALRRPARVGNGIKIGAAVLHAGLSELRARQELNRLTGAVHAAAWVIPESGIVHVREDVGRHNALDKLIGLLVRSGARRDEGYLLVTSRASYEMVQKCAEAGIELMVAISAPTGLAVRLAEDAGITLVGFARDDSHVIYSHSWRLA